MSKLIIKNNGQETQYVGGVDFTTLPPQPNVYYVGVDSVSGAFEKLDPDGSIIDLEAGGGGVFTGGSVNGQTTFLFTADELNITSKDYKFELKLIKKDLTQELTIDQDVFKVTESLFKSWVMM